MLISLALLMVASGTKMEKSHAEMFNSYMTTFSKTYKNEAEYQMRFETFKLNLMLAEERNQAELAAGGGAVNGVTKCSDGSCKKGYIAPSNPTAATQKLRMKASPGSLSCLVSGSVCDWTGIYTTPIRNQGSCGSCWAFSAAEQIESDAIRLLGYGGGPGTVSAPVSSTAWLSTQQITSCDKVDYGCNGGNTETAFAYIKSTPIETESGYPYADGNSNCNSNSWCASTCMFSASKEVVGVTEYYTLSSKTESSMQSYITSTGPLSVCLSAADWDTYTCTTPSGSCIKKTCTTAIDHCVQLVGYAPAGSYSAQSSLAYWIIRNQWGTGWGVDGSGYMWLQYGSNLCVINTDPNYVTPYLVSTTASPTHAPVTKAPTLNPTPTTKPSFRPSKSPISSSPSATPSQAPHSSPTNVPVTASPTTLRPTYAAQCGGNATFYVGDGVCDAIFNVAACAWDGGDCCQQTCSPNAAYTCGSQGYNCLQPGITSFPSLSPSIAPTAPTMAPTVSVAPTTAPTSSAPTANPSPSTPVQPSRSRRPSRAPVPRPTTSPAGRCKAAYWLVGNGYCDQSANNAACKYDGGDCCCSTCVTPRNLWFGFTCGSGGFTCLDPNGAACSPTLSPTLAPSAPTSSPVAGAPSTAAPSSACKAQKPSRLGDGKCDGGQYNTAACNWDGGDCCSQTCACGTSPKGNSYRSTLYSCGTAAAFNCLNPAYTSTSKTGYCPCQGWWCYFGN